MKQFVTKFLILSTTGILPLMGVAENTSPSNGSSSVAITAPANNAVFPAPSDIALSATATFPTGDVARVDFLSGSLVVGTATSAPYGVVWTNVPTGWYTLMARAVSVSGAYVYSTQVHITVGTPLPVVTIQTTDSTAAEPGTNTASFSVTRTGPTNADLIVGYSIGGTAVNGLDYQALPGTATIPAGRTYVSILVQPLDDSLVEGTETVVLKLLAGPDGAYTVGTYSNATASILDNETNTPPSAALTSPAEGAVFRAPANVALTATASDSDGSVLRVYYTAGTAYIGSSTAAPYAVTWSNPAAGSYALTARAVDNLNACGTSTPVNITILPAFPVVTVSTTHYDAKENSTNTDSFRFSRTGDTGTPMTVYYVLGGTAANGTDYQSLPGVVTIPAGTNGVQILIQPIDDTLVEGTETVTVRVAASPDSSYVIGSYSNASAIILDDETNTAPAVALVSPTNNATFPTGSSITLLATASDMDGSVSRVDFLAGSLLLGSATVPPYSIVWTNAPDGYSYVSAKATDNLGAYRYSSSVKITVGTPPPTVTISATDSLAAEPGTNTATFCVSRSGGNSNQSVTVSYAVSGTASNGVDYDLLPGAVTIPANAASAAVVVRPVDDALAEPPESVVLTLTGGSGTGLYVVGSPSSATATIQDNDNALPAVTMTAPTNNANFPAPANILLAADAGDSDGTVTRVMFMSSSTTVLGYATNAPWTFLWTNVAAGTYSVYARAMDNLDGYGTSTPVRITVGTIRPVVNMQTLLSQVSESGTSAGIIQVTRTGDPSSSLPVYYSFSGTATNGVDYVSLSGNVTIPTGATNAQILVQPIDVHIYGGSRYATLYLLTNSAYVVGSPTYATVTILDNDQRPTNAPPAVAIVSPPSGAIFAAPANIPISATASDSDGSIASVSFATANGVIGVVSNAPYGMTWPNVPAGYYTLTARAVDNQGAVRYSEPVRISVVSTNPRPSATRYLPSFYVPGASLTVSVAATPVPGTASFTIVDRPPQGWTVGAISEGGVFNAAQNAVIIGPFTTIWPRNVSYAVTPPAGDNGRKVFAGSIVNDAASNTIGGAYAICRAPAHPADNNPTNLVLEQAELAAYNTAWSTTEQFPVPPNPIPISYLTRAGFLYALGGSYTFSLASPTPSAPLLWVSTNLPPAAAGSPNSIEQPWSATNSATGLAVSSMPSNYTPGVAMTVSIAVTPGTQTLAYAVQDRPPKGWTVANISGGGVYCPLTAVVKWGLFGDNSPRTLTYDVTPAAASSNATSAASFAGVASFNGIDTPVAGQRYARYAAAAGIRTLDALAPVAMGLQEVAAAPPPPASLFTFPGDAGSLYTIEATQDLNGEWSPLDTLLNNDGTLMYIDPEFGSLVMRFYRATPAQDNSVPPPVP